MSTTFHFDEGQLDALFAPFNRGDQPGLAVGVAHRGRPLYRRGYGLASVELPVALTPSTRLRVGSVTKHFCALAVMLLAEDGRLSIGDSIRRHLPELPDWAEPITLSHLMGHTSGMRCSIDALFFLNGAAGRPVPADAQARILRQLRSVNFAAGTDFLYCNGGYTLLTELVERLADEPFGDFLRERILAPVGLHDSLLRADDDACLTNAATLHRARAGGGYDRSRSGVPHDGAGGLVSTVDDMLRWMAHLRQPRVGSASTWAAMREPLRLANGAATGYGLGLMRGAHRGLPVLHHSGAVVGGASQMIQVPDHELDIVILANSGSVDAVGLAEQVINVCISGLPAAPQAALLDIEGSYLDAAAGRLIRLVPHEGATRVDINGARLPLKRLADGTLWCRANPSSGATLAVAACSRDLVWRELGRTLNLPRVQAPEGDAARAPEGVYRVPDLGLTARLTQGPTQSRLDLHGPHGDMTYTLEARAPDAWACVHTHPLLSAGALLLRQGDALTLTTPRTRHLRLESDVDHG
jgi:D-aminopeptidase